MNIEKLKQKKKELGFTNKQISELSGVPLGTVQKIFGKETKTPRRETYLALAGVLDPEEVHYILSMSTGVKEEALAYELKALGKKQGEYTLEDYYAMPEDRRVELIDGIIYDITAPTVPHQLIAGEVHRQLWDCVEEHDDECFPMIAPVDVQLDRDERTMVQPDVIIVCDRELMTAKLIYGAPEFALEVLSPYTKSKDQMIKLYKYMNAGCKEVWIVDPDKRRITTYDFRSENWPDIYSFDDKVPVAISDGRCEVDFSRINRKLKKYEEMISD